jgi:hypothetical protein
LGARPDVTSVIAAANEMVAQAALFFSRKDLSGVPSGTYIGDLLVSFCRSHFVCVDLITQGELIDASVIIRKQMELLSRLHELRAGRDIESLIGKTPNVRHLLLALRMMYGKYSEIAHSSHPDSLRLLGQITTEERCCTPFYPVFDQSAYQALAHVGFLVVEFSLWTTTFYEDVFQKVDCPGDDEAKDFWILFVEFFCRNQAEIDGNNNEAGASTEASEHDKPGPISS